MELLALDYPQTTPLEFVEKWDTLIWHRRYRLPGEFKLVTRNVADTLRLLPVGAMCSTDGSTEVMRVHTNLVEYDDKGRATLTVTGRSLTDFMRYRIATDNWPYLNDKEYDANGNIVNGDPHSWGIGSANWNNADAAAYVMKEHLLTGAFRFGENGAFAPEVMSNLSILSEDTDGRRPYFYFLKRQTLLDAVTMFLIAGGNGIRTQRATATNNDTVFMIYKGVNRTASQTDREALILRQDEGHMLSSKYLMSDEGYYNAFRVYPANAAYRHWWEPEQPGSGVNPLHRTGIYHRDLLVEATEISSESQADIDVGINERISSEIANNQPTYLMECTVAENIPYVFDKDYGLGDLLTLVGEFGIVRNARVDEVIVTEDSNGIRTSPGLTIFQ